MHQTMRHSLGLSVRRCRPFPVRGHASSIPVRRQHSAVDHSNLPRIAQSSFWDLIFPKTIREKSREFFRPAQNKPRNPASYFIWIYLLIGSQAVRILGVQNEHKTYMRKADLKIAKLREVVEKLQRGEEVDVEKVLGTGDPTQEQEWEHALREIENEERVWQENQKTRRAERMRLEREEQRLENERQDASPVSDNTQTQKRPAAPGFY